MSITPSITNFFTPQKGILSNTDVELSPSVRSANKEVEILSKSDSRGVKRKRGNYQEYTPEQRLKIARYAIENGNTSAARHFSRELGVTLNESSVRSIKGSYLKLKKKSQELQSLPRSPRGKPLKVGKYESEICDYLLNLRKAGGVVNRRIVLACDRTALSDYGGPIVLTKAWAVSVMNRLNMVKRKGTKDVKNLPDDFETIKETYLKRINDVVTEYNIPDSLIIHWDQTGSSFVPVGDWTMEVEGSKQVSISCLDDKRHMTVLLACTKSGKMLPPECIYQGKTEQCHPSYKFPDDWHITYSENHWSNSETMERYVEKVIIPYIDGVKEELDLPVRQRALCIFDVVKGHRGEALLELLKRNKRKIGIVNDRCVDIPWEVVDEGVVKSDTKSVLKKWRNEFHKLYNVHDVSSSVVENGNNFDIDISNSELLNAPITDDEVYSAVNALKLNKSCGIDKIPAEVLKNDDCVKMLHKICSACFDSGIVPDQWKSGVINPIFKRDYSDINVIL